MTARPTFGIAPLGQTVAAMGDIAAEAEAAGLDAVWTPELYNRSATITLAEMAHRTDRCIVGSGIAYGIGRSPLTLAAEARDLDEISRGRLILGLGNGTRTMIRDWHGQDPEAPAVRMEELVTLLRRLWNLHREPVDHEGRFYRCKIRPTGDLVAPYRERIPVYIAGVNERMIESAGRVTDGLLGHPLFSVRYVEEIVRPAIQRGAEHAERDAAEVALASLVIAVVDDEDPDAARRQAAAQIAFYCSVKSYAPLLVHSGFAAQGAAVREAFAARDHAAMIAAITDDMIDALSVAGTADDVRSALRRYDGVIDHVVLYAPSFNVTPDRATANIRSLIGLATS